MLVKVLGQWLATKRERPHPFAPSLAYGASVLPPGVKPAHLILPKGTKVTPIWGEGEADTGIRPREDQRDSGIEK